MSDYKYPKNVLDTINEIEEKLERGDILKITYTDSNSTCPDYDDELTSFNGVHKIGSVIYDSYNVMYKSVMDIIDTATRENINYIEENEDGTLNIGLLVFETVFSYEKNFEKLNRLHLLVGDRMANIFEIPYNTCKYTIHDLLEVISNMQIGEKSILIKHLTFNIGSTRFDNFYDFFKDKPNVCVRDIKTPLIESFDYYKIDLSRYTIIMYREYGLSEPEILKELEVSSLVLYVCDSGIMIIKCKHKNIGKYINFRIAK